MRDNSGRRSAGFDAAVVVACAGMVVLSYLSETFGLMPLVHFPVEMNSAGYIGVSGDELTYPKLTSRCTDVPDVGHLRRRGDADRGNHRGHVAPNHEPENDSRSQFNKNQHVLFHSYLF